MIGFRRHRRSPTGFTLVELMVVLALIGILSAAILPQMRGTLEGAVLRRTARELLSAAQMAHSQTITLNQRHWLVLDLDEHRYRIERLERGPDGKAVRIPAPDTPGGHGQWEPRLSVACRKPSAAAMAGFGMDNPVAPEASTPFVASGVVTVPFSPDGTAEEFEIELRDRDGFGVGLRMNPFTSRFRVLTLERVVGVEGSR